MKRSRKRSGRTYRSSTWLYDGWLNIEDSCINHVNKKKAETKTRKKRAVFSTFNERLFAILDKPIVDPSCIEILIDCISWASRVRRRRSNIWRRAGETTRNFKYVQWHKTRPLTISNAMDSEQVVDIILLNLDCIGNLLMRWYRGMIYKQTGVEFILCSRIKCFENNYI